MGLDLLATAPGGGLLEAPFVLVAAHAFCAGRWAGARSGIAGAVALLAAGIVTAAPITHPDESGVAASISGASSQSSPRPDESSVAASISGR